jgi:hypothetical protein
MNKLKLPTAGSQNWGSALNAYLTSFDNRMEAIERKFGDTSENQTIRNLGYASTGLNGSNYEISYNESNFTFSF